MEKELCRTVKMDDPDLVDRLHDAGVKFGAAAPQQTSIWVSLLAGYVPNRDLRPSWPLAE